MKSSAITTAIDSAIERPIHHGVYRPFGGGRRKSLSRRFADILKGRTGIWYDPQDLTTMYQDAAGTLPVYRPGSGAVDPPVGLILDKSGNDIHASQSTTTARPTLSGRYNLLTNTGFAGAVSGTPGTAPTDWPVGFNIGTTLVTERGIRYSATNGRIVQRCTTVPTSVIAEYIFSYDSFVYEPGQIIQFIGREGTTVATTSYYCDGVLVDPLYTVPVGYHKLSIKLNVTTSGTLYPRVGVGCSSNATGDIEIWNPDLRVSNDGVGLPPYQRVVNANTYDTAGFPLYLKFDGVDDYLQTANVDLTGADEVTVGFGGRKERSTTEIIVEHGGSTTTNPRAWDLVYFNQSPIVAFYQQSGTISYAQASTTDASLYWPKTSTMLGRGKTTSNISELFVNGTLAGSSSTVQGAGNFTNAPLAIGGRLGGTLLLKGRIYSLCILGTLLSPSEQATLERYLNSKTRAY